MGQLNRPFSDHIGFVLKTLVFATLLNYAPQRYLTAAERLELLAFPEDEGGAQTACTR